MFKPVDDDGRFTDLAPAFVRGLFVKDADPDDRGGPRERGVLLRAETHTSTTTRSAGAAGRRSSTTRARRGTCAPPQVKDRLLAVNDGVDWYPEHIRDGRYGNWLENNVDWALSRERYWGTPAADLALRAAAT